MSNAARKARKRAGIKFVKPAKVGTPLEDRHVPLVLKKGPDGNLGWHESTRALRRLKRHKDAAAGRLRFSKGRVGWRSWMWGLGLVWRMPGRGVSTGV